MTREANLDHLAKVVKIGKPRLGEAKLLVLEGAVGQNVNQSCLTPIIPQFFGVLGRETEAGAHSRNGKVRKAAPWHLHEVCIKRTSPKVVLGGKALS